MKLMFTLGWWKVHSMNWAAQASIYFEVLWALDLESNCNSPSVIRVRDLPTGPICGVITVNKISTPKNITNFGSIVSWRCQVFWLRKQPCPISLNTQNPWFSGLIALYSMPTFCFTKWSNPEKNSKNRKKLKTWHLHLTIEPKLVMFLGVQIYWR